MSRAAETDGWVSCRITVMIPGPDKIIACSCCGAPAKMFTLVSGNTCGATYWTDGKMEAPMLPQAPAVTKCHACGRFYWLKDAPTLGQMGGGFHWDQTEPEPVPLEEWKQADHVKELSAQQYLQAIEANAFQDQSQEVTLRTLAMRGINDRWRHPQWADSQHPLPQEAWQDNLERLIALLDEHHPEQRLLKAEAARNLGRFELAIDLLNATVPSKYQSAARTILDLARGRHKTVERIR